MGIGNAAPRDPRLNPFRDAVWELSRAGKVEAYLTTQVTDFTYWPFGRTKREGLWFQVCWLDGQKDPPEDDYGPEWYVVADLERGRFEDGSNDGSVFDAKPVANGLSAQLWERLGPP